MQLFELEPVISEMTKQAESEHASVHRSTKKSIKHPSRQELPADLPRVERILPAVSICTTAILCVDPKVGADKLAATTGAQPVV